jgi:hypothetical protein
MLNPHGKAIHRAGQGRALLTRHLVAVSHGEVVQS